MARTAEQQIEYNLLARAIDYLEMYFEELRGEQTDREWSDLEHEVIDVVNDLKAHIGDTDGCDKANLRVG